MRCPDCDAEHSEGFACSRWVIPCSQTVDPTVIASDALPRTLAPLPPESETLVGRTLRGFKLVRKLGRGGMATVYLGEQREISSRVAIKVLHRGLGARAALVAQCYAEARAVNVIEHPNIVRIFSLGVLRPSRPYLVMEYLEGETLAALLRRRKTLCLEEALPILTQLCAALDAAHQRGIVHRDLKPANVLLQPGPFVKVLDFGAAQLGGALRRDLPGAERLIFGTPAYMAPEQLSGREVDARCDLYALGVTCYLMATGQLPFPGISDAAKLFRAHALETPPPPIDLNPSVSPGWSRLIQQLLSKEPQRRGSGAAEVSRTLVEIFEHERRPRLRLANELVEDVFPSALAAAL